MNEMPPAAPIAEPEAAIAALRQRVGAAVIDGVFLWLVGLLIGGSLATFWHELGPWGRLAGLTIQLLYFGIMGSHLTGGATVGKRVLGIAVRDRQNGTLTLRRSFLRAAILNAPFALNGWQIPILEKPFFTFLGALIIFGVGGSILLTLLLNRGTRQGLHDVLVGTYVLRAVPTGPLPRSGRLPLVVTVVMLVASASVFLIGNRAGAGFMDRLQPLIQLQQTLANDDRLFTVGVTDHRFAGADGTSRRTLKVRAWQRGSDESGVTSLTDSLATSALTLPQIDRFDAIRIEIVTGYDILLSSSWHTSVTERSVEDWRVYLKRER